MSKEIRSHNIRIPRPGQEFNLSEASQALKDACTLEGMTAKPDSSLQVTYFSHKTEFRCEPYISQAKNKHLRKTIAMFRTGSHWLQVCQGRYQGIAYNLRKCPLCPWVIDDEKHAIFECPHYNNQRRQFADLFDDNSHNLRSFLLNNPTHRVALFLTACKAARLTMANPACRFQNVTYWLDVPQNIIEDLLQ